MRRKRISSGSRKSLRAGVTASVATTKISVQSPVWCVMYSMGLAVRLWWIARQATWPSGIRQKANTGNLIHLLLRTFRKRSPSLIILLQVHARVERRNLVIAIEHHGGAAEELAQAALLGLGPARVIHLGVDVGIKPVFAGGGHVP